MPCKSKDLAPNSEGLIFLLAIAGRIDAQSRLLAQKLDESRYVYHGYAVLDSLSSSYSMLKWFFEVCLSNNDPDYMHDMLTSPAGVAAVSTEVLFLVSFSLLASVYDGEEKNSVKKFIASAWPYFRDVIKGLKNAYKGWKSAAHVLSMMTGADLKYMIVPVGLFLGILAAANRLWFRSMIEARKKHMNDNKKLLIEIQRVSILIPLNRQSYLLRIASQDDEERVHAYLSVVLGGLLDGLYLYLGVTSLSVLVPPLFLMLSVIGIFYTLCCVVVRIYEEYDFQLRLMMTKTKCELALVTKEIEITREQLLSLEGKKEKTDDDKRDIEHLKLLICKLIEKFDKSRKSLKQQSTHSYFTAALSGMKYGLYAYGMLLSALFMIASISFVISPVLLAVFVMSGLVLIAGFTAYTLRTHSLYLMKQKEVPEEENPYKRLMEMKENIELDKGVNADVLTTDRLTASLKAGLAFDPSPQFFFQEWFEVIRSLTSGLYKGKNFSNFASTPFQEADPDGHYHDTPVMRVFEVLNAAFFSLTLGLRALARGLGRSSPPEQVNASGAQHFELSTRDTKINPSEESSDLTKNPASECPLKNGSFVLNHRFFDPKKRKSFEQSIKSPTSEVSLPLFTCEDHTVPGLG